MDLNKIKEYAKGYEKDCFPSCYRKKSGRKL